MTELPLRAIKRICGLLLLAAGPAFGAAPADGRSAPDPRVVLQEKIFLALREHLVPGAAVSIVDRRGILWEAGFGKADLAKGRPVTPQTLFRVGSITKGLVAMAILKLASEGKLDIHARLADAAPWLKFENPWEETRPVRIEHLLEHTAGWDDQHFNELYYTEGAELMPLRVALARNPNSRRSRWPPGTRMSYSNPDYAVLGSLIESVAGEPYQQYITREILQPAGMTSSRFQRTVWLSSFLANGYSGPGLHLVPYRFLVLHPSGNLATSAEDLGRWVQLLLGEGRAGKVEVVHPGVVARMMRTETLPYPPILNSYGTAIYGDVESEIPLWGHGGRMEGYRAVYRFSPDRGRGFVLLFNGDALPDAVLRDIKNAAVRCLMPEEPKAEAPPPELSPFKPGRYTGFYAARNPQHQFLAFRGPLLEGTWVYSRGGSLYAKKVFREPRRLVPAGAEAFHYPGQSGASMTFGHNLVGTPILYARDLYAEKQPSWKPWMLRAVFGTVLGMIVSALGFPFWWIPQWILRRPRKGSISLRILPAVPLLCGVLAAMIIRATPLCDLGSVNLETLAILALTALFPLSSAAGVALTMRLWKRETCAPLRFQALGASLACCLASAYFSHYGLLALRLWSW